MIPQNLSAGKTSRVRHTAQLGTELEKRLSAYARVTAASGIGLLALIDPAEAKVIYTPESVPILINGGRVPLDLNHDGIADFVFSNQFSYSDSGDLYAHLYISPGSAGSRNTLWGRGVMNGIGKRRFASALPAGFSIRPNKMYFQKSPKAILAAVTVDYNYLGYVVASHTSGQWLYTQDRYLGLRFMVSGQTHYGWARVAVNFEKNNKIVAALIAYAYETIPNKPILTGKTNGQDVVTLEPASLGRLGQGTSGISAWRSQK